MEKEYILVIDSGLGGVTILKSLMQKLSGESFIYLADNLNSPYGNKSKKFLQQNIINLLTKVFSQYKIKLVVFACNTLTATTINKVRKHFNVKFVGTEPAIKQVSLNEKTLVLATEQTHKNCKILKKYKNNKNFDFLEIKNVASFLDKNFFNREKIIYELANQIKNKSYKNVVLGCTHYYFLENEIKVVLNNENIKFFKSIKGVVNRVTSLVENNKNEQEYKIMLTKEDKLLSSTIEFLLKF